MNIYLVGFMGSGKSTVGKILAERLGMQFIDLDEEIEKQEGMKIKDIFKEKGEKYFRELERKKLEEIIQKDGLVVSTGGGLGANFENMEKMKKTGKVTWLDVSLDTVFKRCGKDENRPLLNMPYEKLEKLFNERKDVYKLSDIHINVENKTPQQIVEEIIENLRWN